MANQTLESFVNFPWLAAIQTVARAEVLGPTSWIHNSVVAEVVCSEGCAMDNLEGGKNHWEQLC